jgi:hypothetical protein
MVNAIRLATRVWTSKRLFSLPPTKTSWFVVMDDVSLPTAAWLSAALSACNREMTSFVGEAKLKTLSCCAAFEWSSNDVVYSAAFLMAVVNGMPNIVPDKFLAYDR